MGGSGVKEGWSWWKEGTRFFSVWISRVRVGFASGTVVDISTSFACKTFICRSFAASMRVWSWDGEKRIRGRAFST